MRSCAYGRQGNRRADPDVGSKWRGAKTVYWSLSPIIVVFKWVASWSSRTMSSSLCGDIDVVLPSWRDSLTETTAFGVRMHRRRRLKLRREFLVRETPYLWTDAHQTWSSRRSSRASRAGIRIVPRSRGACRRQRPRGPHRRLGRCVAQARKSDWNREGINHGIFSRKPRYPVGNLAKVCRG